MYDVVRSGDETERMAEEYPVDVPTSVGTLRLEKIFGELPSLETEIPLKLPIVLRPVCSVSSLAVVVEVVGGTHTGCNSAGTATWQCPSSSHIRYRG